MSAGPALSIAACSAAAAAAAASAAAAAAAWASSARRASASSFAWAAAASRAGREHSYTAFSASVLVRPSSANRSSHFSSSVTRIEGSAVAASHARSISTSKAACRSLRFAELVAASGDGSSRLKRASTAPALTTSTSRKAANHRARLRLCVGRGEGSLGRSGSGVGTGSDPTVITWDVQLVPSKYRCPAFRHGSRYQPAATSAPGAPSGLSPDALSGVPLGPFILALPLAPVLRFNRCEGWCAKVCRSKQRLRDAGDQADLCSGHP